MVFRPKTTADSTNTVELQTKMYIVIVFDWPFSVKLLSMSALKDIQGNTQGQKFYLKETKFSEAFTKTIVIHYSLIQNTINLLTV